MKAKADAKAKSDADVKAKADAKAKSDVKADNESKTETESVTPEKRGRKGKTTKRRVARAGRRAALSAIINDDAPKVVAKEKPSAPKVVAKEKPSAPKVEQEETTTSKLDDVLDEPKAQASAAPKKAPAKRKKLSISDATKLDTPVKEDPDAKVDLQSKIAGTSAVDLELSRQEMIDSVRAVADDNEVPVSIIISDALNRDATQFDDASDEEIGYIYKKYVLNMGDES